MSLYREFELDNPQRWIAAQNFVQSNMEAMITANTPLRLIVTTAESTRNQEQNKRYWKAVLEPIAAQAWINGNQFSKEAWHEHYARRFGYYEEMKLPYGERVLRRKSTSEYKVKEFSDYMTHIEADAATEFGVRFPA